MKANFIFPNVTAYDVEKVDVLVGETFTINLPDETEPVDFFFNNDSVLEINAEGTKAIVKALSFGDCVIKLERNDVVLKKLYLSVYTQQAVELNPVVGTPVLKGKK
jgi:hypothetical protein